MEKKYLKFSFKIFHEFTFLLIVLARIRFKFNNVCTVITNQ